MKNIQYIEPKINIGDCKNGHKTILEGDSITIWLSTIYNIDSYIINFVSNLSFVQVSEYEYTVTGDILGFNEIYLQAFNKDKLVELRSNSLLIIVLEDNVLSLDFSKPKNSSLIHLITTKP